MTRTRDMFNRVEPGGCCIGMGGPWTAVEIPDGVNKWRMRQRMDDRVTFFLRYDDRIVEVLAIVVDPEKKTVKPDTSAHLAVNNWGTN